MGSPVRIEKAELRGTKAKRRKGILFVTALAVAAFMLGIYVLDDTLSTGWSIAVTGFVAFAASLVFVPGWGKYLQKKVNDLFRRKK